MFLLLWPPDALDPLPPPEHDDDGVWMGPGGAEGSGSRTGADEGVLRRSGAGGGGFAAACPGVPTPVTRAMAACSALAVADSAATGRDGAVGGTGNPADDGSARHVTASVPMAEAAVGAGPVDSGDEGGELTAVSDGAPDELVQAVIGGEVVDARDTPVRSAASLVAGTVAELVGAGGPRMVGHARAASGCDERSATEVVLVVDGAGALGSVGAADGAVVAVPEVSGGGGSLVGELLAVGTGSAAMGAGAGDVVGDVETVGVGAVGVGEAVGVAVGVGEGADVETALSDSGASDTAG